MQVQQADVKSGVKMDLLEALAQVSHTGVYGLQVCSIHTALPSLWTASTVIPVHI